MFLYINIQLGNYTFPVSEKNYFGVFVDDVDQLVGR